MRRLILSMMVSVDGFIEDSQKNIDWHVWTSEMNDFMSSFFTSVDTILLGRKTYENMVDYWPGVTSEEQKIADAMNKFPKIVLSTTISSSNWDNTHFINENAKDEILKLKKTKGKDIVAFGGAGLSSFLTNHNLIDEYRIIINPVILGKGTAVFNQVTKIKQLKFKKAFSFDCGNNLLIFNPK